MLKQLIKVLTRITFYTSTLIDHILTNSSEKVVQTGIIETSLPDHQITFCTRKIKRAKPNKHNYLIFCSMKNLSTEVYEKALGKLTFFFFSFIVTNTPHLNVKNLQSPGNLN